MTAKAETVSPPLPEPYEADWKALRENADVGGVEYVNIRDCCEAAEYGWRLAVDHVEQSLPEVFTADDVRAFALASLAAKEVELVGLREVILEGSRWIESLKRECGTDPESPTALQNSRYMSISYFLRAALTQGAQS